MKCEKCGKNEATCFYSSNINGKITEKHLCSQCAAEENMDFFPDFEKQMSQMSRAFENTMQSMFAPMGFFQPMFAPTFEVSSPLGPLTVMRLSSPTVTSTPAGIVIGLTPILDILSTSYQT